MILFRTCLILFFLVFNLGIEAEPAKDPAFFPDLLGVWLSENKKQRIRVTYNPKTKMYTGKVEYMYEDDASAGRVMLDTNNPNVKLRKRRITGINMLYNFLYEGDSKFRGYVYDPISGKEYRCLMTLRPDRKTAEIRGYIFFPWIGRTEIATKYSN